MRVSVIWLVKGLHTTVSMTWVERMFFGGFGVDVNVVDMARVLWERTSEVVYFLSWANMSGL